MTKELRRPSWYQDEFYEKKRTAEEWLYEFCKRVKFKRDDIGLSHSIRILPIKEQEKYFIEFIFNQQIEGLLNILKATLPQPIKSLSVSDVFRMYHLLINTSWYKNHPRRYAFESAISKITNNGTLTRKQKNAFMEMHDTPWCAFHENHKQDSWHPNKEINYLSGIPLSLDPSYSKNDSSTILKRKLTAWVGKTQDIRLQFDTWQESKILAVFDLMHWFEIQGIKYKKIGLHKLIWSNGRVSKSTGGELVEPNDDIKHSIRLVNKVINESVIRSLFILCEGRKFKKEMAAL